MQGPPFLPLHRSWGQISGVLGKTDVVIGEAVNSCTDGYEGSSYGPLLRVTLLKPPAGLGLLTRMFGDECAAKSTRGAHQRK